MIKKKTYLPKKNKIRTVEYVIYNKFVGQQFRSVAQPSNF